MNANVSPDIRLVVKIHVEIVHELNRKRVERSYS